jgi:hypothetical protein
VIVDVIPASTQRAERSNGPRHLSLSNDQMHFVYVNVPKNHRANVRIQLALGAEIPRDVELMSFPAEVVDHVPDLKDYRYVVIEDQVVVCDPKDRGVSLVITQ